MKITVNAAAKINLFLDITGRLGNDYHSLFTLMQSVGLYDTVTLELRPSGGITFSCSDKTLPTDRSNLAWKAAEAFFTATGAETPGLAIHIAKRIPQAAGLAGGSADAAAVLAGLNQLQGTNLSAARLSAIGLSVGSDVPFCLQGGTMLAQHTGAVLSPLPPLSPCHILLVRPEQQVSTRAAYQAYDEAGTIHRPDTLGFLDAAARGDFRGICRCAANVFEQVVEVERRVEIKAILRTHGAALAQMSGSGPSIFGLFEEEADARQCADALAALPVEVFLCEPVERGLEIFT